MITGRLKVCKLTTKMGQSLLQLYVHLIFGVKDRRPLITEEHSSDLQKYIYGIFKNLESPALIINSVPDHIHILFRLSKNHALANIVQEVKKASSKWMKTDGSKNQTFKWQIGYGAFSVSSSKVEVVRRYIKNQKKYHQKMTYKQELEKFMKKYDVIEYKSEYFWLDLLHPFRVSLCVGLQSLGAMPQVSVC